MGAGAAKQIEAVNEIARRRRGKEPELENARDAMGRLTKAVMPILFEIADGFESGT
jgi:hypothetical protein